MHNVYANVLLVKELANTMKLQVHEDEGALVLSYFCCRIAVLYMGYPLMSP